MNSLQKFYRGFYIDLPVGNNAFSYPLRNIKRIFVPELITGDIGELAIGEEAAFAEVVSGREVCYPGLRRFLHLQREDKEIFIFDNHNHAFFFWLYWLKNGKFKKGTTLVHVDQHRDTREPEKFLKIEEVESIDLREAFDFTNFVLNVGNFIKPALALGVFEEVLHVDSRSAFESTLPEEFVLDIDADIFSADMAYIDHDYKLEKIRSYIDRAKLITIASSPFFIEQERAIQVIKDLL